MNTGTVQKLDDGRYALRFEQRFPHSAAKVWRALTEAGELREWFVEILDYERSRLTFEPGADLAFVTTAGDSAGSGRVVACEPPVLLEYTWDTETLRFELTEDGPGATVLVFTNIVADHGTAVAVRAGWSTGLDRLGARLDGTHALR